MPRRLDSSAAGFARDFEAFLRAERAETADVDAAAAAILADVRARGDEAVADYTARFDKVTGPLRIPVETLDRALAQTPKAAREALELAASRIEAFHRAQMPADLDYRDATGTRLGLRWTPVEAVGLYVPGGAAAYPSSVLMNAIPARVAGVERLAMTVPTPAGAFDPLVFAAARLVGIDRSLSDRRGAGGRRARLRHAKHRPGGQDRRPRKCLGGVCKAAGVRTCRHRHDRRPVRGACCRGRLLPRLLDRSRPDGPGRT